MAFRKKAASIIELNPDILVVPECENREKLLLPKWEKQPESILWTGLNPNKGLGVFTFNNYKIIQEEYYADDIKYVVPVKVKAPNSIFSLLAIWANNPKDKDGCYVEQVWKGIQLYNKLIKKTKTIIAGDFNSNKIWDSQHRKWSHTSVVNELGKKGITSAYHSHFQEEHGLEKVNTLYLHRHTNKPYHIDYCFLSSDLTQKLKSVSVGNFDTWIKHSDHMPLIIDIEI